MKQRVFKKNPSCHKSVDLLQEKEGVLLLNPSGFFDVKPTTDLKNGHHGIPGGRYS
jgi:hypothetical protein